MFFTFSFTTAAKICASLYDRLACPNGYLEGSHSILLIHSPRHGHLGCLQLPTTLNFIVMGTLCVPSFCLVESFFCFRLDTPLWDSGMQGALSLISFTKHSQMTAPGMDTQAHLVYRALLSHAS